MSQLSNYIHGQLTSLRKEVERTPPKKHSSLAKIEALVRTAPLPKTEKEKLKSQIKEIQSAIIVASTPKKKNRKSPQKTSPPTTHSILRLSQDYEAVRYLVKTKLRQGHQEPNRVESLRKKFEELRGVREQKEQYLKELIVKVQRIERIAKARAKSASSKKREAELTSRYEQRKETLRGVREMALGAAREGRGEVVRELMQAYCYGLDKKSMI